MVIFVIVLLIFHDVRVVQRWNRKISQFILLNPYIKIETLRGNIVSIIYVSLKKVSGNAKLDRNTVQWWHKYFTEGRVSTEDNPCSVCPSTAIDNTSIVIVATVHDKNWCATTRESETETEIPGTTVHCILTEHLFKKKVAVWWVPHALTETQKQTRLKITQEHLKWFKRRKYFEPDNCCWWDMGTRFRAWIKIPK